MKTYDNVEVQEADTVWVIGSTGVHSTTVLPPVTSYQYFGNIPVSMSFSSRIRAEEYLSNKRNGK